MENYLLKRTLEAFQLSSPDFPSFSYETEHCVIEGGRYVDGGWWKGGSLPFQKGPRTKQETIPLFWLVVATSVWNLAEVNPHVCAHVCAQVRACTHKQTHTHTITHSGGNVWHTSMSRDTKNNPASPVDVMKSDRRIEWKSGLCGSKCL